MNDQSLKAALVAVAVAAWYLISAGNGDVCRAQAAGHQVQTASFRTVDRIKQANGQITTDSSDVWFHFPDQTRSVQQMPAVSSTNPTVSPPGDIFLINATGHPGTMVNLNGQHVTIQQVLFAGVPSVPFDQSQWLNHLRDMDGKQIVRKGEEILNGRKMIRFEQPAHSFDPVMPDGIMTIWVDATTSLPVRLNIKTTTPVKGGFEDHSMEIDDLRFEPPLADSLFAWPDLNGKIVSQMVTIHVSRETLLNEKFKITTADGQVLVTAADLQPPLAKLAAGHGPDTIQEMTPVAAQRIKKACSDQAGQKLMIYVDGMKAQTLDIFGKLAYIAVAVPSNPPPAENATTKNSN